MLLAIAIVAQIMAVAALVMRKGWRTVRVLFCAEMIQAGMMLSFYILPSNSPFLFHLWHDDRKISFLLYLAVGALYVGEKGLLLLVSLLSLIAAILVLLLYATTYGDATLEASGLLYQAHNWLAVFIDICVALAVYTRSVSNPHTEEYVCQKTKKHKQSHPQSHTHSRMV